MDRKVAKFICPKCKSNKLQELERPLVGITDIEEIQYTPDQEGEVDDCYLMHTRKQGGEPLTTYGAVNPEETDKSYRCLECGWVLPDVEDPKDLVKWIVKNCSE